MKTYSTRELPLLSFRRPNLALQPRNNFVGMKSSDRAAREEILHRAYEIWEREGHPTDRQLANWLEAEAQVMARS